MRESCLPKRLTFPISTLRERFAAPGCHYQDAAGDVADPGCAVAIMHRSEHRPETRQAARAFALQADAFARTDQAEDALAAQMQVGDLGPVRWCGQLGDQDIADVGSGILMRDQEPLSLQVGPVDDGVSGERMV
ncbi:hypothetical protein [Paracoccus thiocyanatus]|uniref:hypothetical protein n=1 Tax=Paracoccus thiocyanatus TaxID=34006 RepID=UPI0015F249D4|nr:hypothetical protein [Paracoccus thiocyanatus]